MFRKYSVNLPEVTYRQLQRYAQSVGASIDQVVDYAVREWLSTTNNQTVKAANGPEQQHNGKTKLVLVWRK